MATNTLPPKTSTLRNGVRCTCIYCQQSGLGCQLPKSDPTTPAWKRAPLPQEDRPRKRQRVVPESSPAPTPSSSVKSLDFNLIAAAFASLTDSAEVLSLNWARGDGVRGDRHWIFAPQQINGHYILFIFSKTDTWYFDPLVQRRITYSEVLGLWKNLGLSKNPQPPRPLWGTTTWGEACAETVLLLNILFLCLRLPPPRITFSHYWDALFRGLSNLDENQELNPSAAEKGLFRWLEEIPSDTAYNVLARMRELDLAFRTALSRYLLQFRLQTGWDTKIKQLLHEKQEKNDELENGKNLLEKFKSEDFANTRNGVMKDIEQLKNSIAETEKSLCDAIAKRDGFRSYRSDAARKGRKLVAKLLSTLLAALEEHGRTTGSLSLNPPYWLTKRLETGPQGPRGLACLIQNANNIVVFEGPGVSTLGGIKPDSGGDLGMRPEVYYIHSDWRKLMDEVALARKLTQIYTMDRDDAGEDFPRLHGKTVCIAGQDDCLEPISEKYKKVQLEHLVKADLVIFAGWRPKEKPFPKIPGKKYVWVSTQLPNDIMLWDLFVRYDPDMVAVLLLSARRELY